MSKSIDESLSLFRDSVQDAVKSGKSIHVTTHIDCDGITSGAIMTKALMRQQARCSVSTAKDFGPHQTVRLKKSGRDLHIITDLGGGSAKEIDEALADKWFVLDHHQIPEEEYDNPRVINAWKYGMDGGTEICGGGMAYLAARKMDEKNADLSALAIVSALGDRQDQGERRSFVGQNSEIAGTASSMGLVDIEQDLLLVGRETRSLIDALAFTSQPFIEGLTWNRSQCYSLLKSAGIRLKDGNRWRVPAELKDSEKRSIIESIAKFASNNSTGSSMDELIGCTYTFPREDRQSILRDGREYSTMLNSCGRIGKSGVGIAICIGDRSRMPAMGQKAMSEYKGRIREIMNVLSSERWRMSPSAKCIMINGEGVVPETMAGTICSLVAGSPKHSSKIAILRTDGDSGTVKFSSRKFPECKIDVNLSKIMRSGAEKLGGQGGGHKSAAGATIPKSKLDEFLEHIDANVS